MTYSLKINGKTHKLDVDGDTPLLWVLRDNLHLTGTKYGCGIAQCGACTVHIDGMPARACVTPIESLDDSSVTTIEHINGVVTKAVQSAWTDREVAQCGFCQSGQIMSAVALLTENKSPSDQDIDDAMSGNVCRCATYVRVRAAIKDAANNLAKGV